MQSDFGHQDESPGRATLSGRLPSVSRSLQVVAVVVSIIILARTAYQLGDLRSLAIEDARHQMSQLDMVLAEQTGRAMETVDFMMRDVADQLAGSDGPPLAPDEVRRRIAGVRQLQAIVATDAQGRIVWSSRTEPGGSLPRAGLDLLGTVQVSAAPDMLISDPIRGLDGSWTMLAVRRLPGPSFHGLIVGVVSLGYFEDFYKAVALGQNGAILLYRRDGTLLARYPRVENAVGTSFAELPPFRDVLSRDIAGTLDMDSSLDGSRRILAVRALRSVPLVVSVSVDEAQVLANWRRQTWIFAVAAIVGALVLAMLLLQLARRSREIETLLSSSRTARDAAEDAHRDVLVQMEERERAELALRQAQRVEAVGQLTGGVAHDFNNLLTVVLGNIELMQGTEASAPFNNRLATMRAAAERGAMLTAQLLAFARRQPLVPRAVDLNVLIGDMTPLLQSAVGSLVTIRLELAPKVISARVDSTQIELVILNLAINARDAMPNGGTLRLCTSTRSLPDTGRGEGPPGGEYACLSVEDTGTGMTPEILARVFEPFFTTKGPGAGSGLGLSQVYGVARQSGGTTQIDSTPGVGTAVRVFLPLATAEDTAPPSQPPSPSPLPTTPPKPAGRATLLVVDDDGDVRSTTALLLRRMGYAVIEAEDAHQALDVLAATPAIDLLLTDVVMPGVSGPDLARRSLEMRPNLPVVFFSGYADPEALTGSAPLHRLLRKPFRPAELAAVIEAGLSDTVTS